MPTIETARFGKLEIDKGEIIRFPEGLLGFPEQKDYVIIEHGPGSPFYWLQSLVIPDLCFVMIDPFVIKNDYLEDIPYAKKKIFEGKNNENICVFALVSIAQGERKSMTVNLLGPIVVDIKRHSGRQAILSSSGYSHQHALNFQ